MTEEVRITFRSDGTREVARDIRLIGVAASEAATSVDFLQRSLKFSSSSAGFARSLSQVSSSSSAASSEVMRTARTVEGASISFMRARDSLGRFVSQADGVEPTTRRASAGVRKLAEEKMRLEGVTRRADSAVSFFRRTLLLIGGAAAVRGIVGVADAFTNLQNRIRVVTAGQGELNAVTNRLLALSNATRTSLASNANVYSRLALSVKDLGVSQDQVLRLTQSLNQAVILSGAGAAEAQAGLIQLTQGLGSGALRGDELRSVLEQIPVVADVIAESLGVTRGELRKLGTDGKITSDIILKAFAEAETSLAERFATAIPTVGQAFQVLTNQLQIFIGRINEGSGASRLLVNAILFISENLETFSRVVLAGLFVVGVNAAIGAVISLTAAIAANPIGFFITALTTTISIGVAALIAFADQIKLTSDGTVTLQDFALAAFDLIGEAIRGFFDLVSSVLPAIATIFGSTFSDEPIKDFIFAVAGAIDSVIKLGRGTVNVLEVLFENFGATIRAPFVVAVNAIVELVNSAIRKVVKAFNELIALLDEQAQKVGRSLGLGTLAAPQIPALDTAEASQLGKDFATAFSEGFQSGDIVTGTVTDVFERARERATERSSSEGAGPGGEVDLTQIQGMPLSEFEIALKAFKSSFDEIDVSAKAVAATIGGQLVSAISDASGAFAEFALSGFQDLESLRESLANVFRDLAKQILQLIIQTLILKAIQAGLGAAGGAGGAGGVASNVGGIGGAAGVTAGAGGIFGLQSGGPAERGRPVLVGENRPEIFTPPVRGRIEPRVEMQQQPTTVLVMNSFDDDTILASLDTPAGTQKVVNKVRRNRRAIE